MADTPLPSPPPAPPRRLPAGLVLGLCLSVLLAAGGYAAYRLWQQEAALAALQARVAELDERYTRLNARQSDAISSAQRSSSVIAAFASRLEEYDQIIGQINEQTQGGRARMQLIIVEHLLLTANERALLARDAEGAALALELASERIGSLKEPRLFKLREAIAAERAALAGVPKVDLTAAALTLASLAARAPKLPLAAQAPERFEGVTEAARDAAPAESGALERLWRGMRHALSEVFSVRKARGPAPRLLPPDQADLVHQVLLLKIEAARSALLRGDAASLREVCQSAARWLRDYYRSDDPGVLTAQAELERLRDLPLDPPMPELSRSLTLLRGYLEAAPK